MTERDPKKTWDNIRPFIGDDKEDGPDTALVLKGFSGRESIEAFIEALVAAGIVRMRQQQ